MNLFDVCFKSETDGYVELRVGGVHKPHCRWIPVSEISDNIPQKVPEAYFGPAVRKEPNVLGKANYLCSNVCWIDHDSLMQPPSIMPPTAVVWSGHGWHYYWRLSQSCSKAQHLENVNNRLAQSMGSDSCHNADRILRIPGTINAKDEKNPVLCKLSEIHANRVYSLRSLYASTRLDEKTTRRILTGDQRGYPSRSERDMSIVRALLTAGMEDAHIHLIFEYHECGDKYRDPRTDQRYLEHTIESAHKTANRTGRGKHDVEEDQDGYYIHSGKGRRRVSTFVLTPTMLLEQDDDKEDVFLCDVKAAGIDRVWSGLPLPMHVFTNSRALTKCMNKGQWTWLGSDADVRILREHLMNQLIAEGTPRARAVSAIGRYDLDGLSYMVTNDCVMSPVGNVWKASDGPIVYVDPGRGGPVMSMTNFETDVGFLQQLARTLPQLNTSDVVWPLIGWFMAAPLKTELEKYGYRFPILNVFGTRGSGKTTLILRVFHPLLGYAEERSYDANTTRFVTLALLGSSNAIPIAFSEFRIASTTNFTRYILLAYDTGRDPRGRADQTTVDYPLMAPFSVDGEDMVEDSASIERVLAVRLTPSTIAEGSTSWSAFNALQELGDLRDFAGPYYIYTLNVDVPWLLDKAEQDVWEVFEDQLPGRVRRNLIVTWFGILSFCQFMESNGVPCEPMDGATVLQSSLDNVYSVKLGRAPTEADFFVELISNAAAKNSKAFPWELDAGILWFQLAPAFEFYAHQKSMQRRPTLSRKAIKIQLMELMDEYTVSPETRLMRRGKVWAYGIDLKRAHEAGLDLPMTFKQGRFVID